MASTAERINARIASFVAFNFLSYLSIGVTLAVLPTYVHERLGVDTVGAGLLVSLQYVATFVTRPRAGHVADTVGPKRTVLLGFAASIAGSAFLVLGSALVGLRPVALIGFALSRVCMGTGESFCGTGAAMWALGRVGQQHTAKVVSYNGVATYSALAIGAPLGVLLEEKLGLTVAALALMLMNGAALGMARRLADVPPTHTTNRMPLRRVLVRVVPYGLALGLGGLGFGVIATFASLYFTQMRWDGAALTLTVFGFCYVMARLTMLKSIQRFGGYRVAQVCFVVEATGLLILAFGTTPHAAHVAAAFIGFGFALVFPSLAVELVKSFPESSRGSALSIYNAFVDLSFFLTGPVAGVIIDHDGYRVDFVGTAAAVLGALLLASWLKRTVGTDVAHEI